MNRISRRAMSVFVLVAMIITGMCVYIVKYAVHGDSWAAFSANGNTFSGGKVMTGTVTDRNGTVLAYVEDGERKYSEDKAVRISTLHAVGDRDGNIGTGALIKFVSGLTGYDPITGTYSYSGNGSTVRLSIDAELNKAAYEALNGRSGCVAVLDYETNEILCMVSSPSFDPASPPEISEDDTSGVYINRFLSSAYTPGSVFKLVTLAAAIENIDDLYDRVFTCEGGTVINGEKVSCTRTHGELKIEDALAVSCNCAFAELSQILGPDILAEYAEKFGLTESFDVDNISTAKGNFDKAEKGSASLAWSGIGQYTDTVNPAAMLRFVSAIANSGKAPCMTLLKKGFDPVSSSERIMSADTAEKIAAMMNYNVMATYGKDNFPGLDLYAKSGTAEVGGGKDPHAWFVGFIRSEGHPLAFVTVVENGGWGSSAAGEIANKVLQKAVNS